MAESWTPALGERFERALVYATQLHALQERKGSGVPYVSHLLGVASLVLEGGGDEEQAIAALLHDAAEDQGGEPRIADIRVRFGERVARIVHGCSDTFVEPKPAWRPRKEAYIARLKTERNDVRLVSVADKLHNARTILVDYRVHGDALFSRFTGRKEGTLWYYQSLVAAYRDATFATPLLDELERTVAELVAVTATGAEPTPAIHTG